MSDPLDEIKSIVLKHFASYDVSIFLFGSRAKGRGRVNSDVDIAFYAKETLPNGVLADLRESLEESSIVLTVELVDLAQSDKKFRNKVLREGVLWKDFKKES